MHQTLEFRGSLRVRLAPYALAAVLMPAALLAVGSQAGPPRPKGSASEAITTAEGKALADWTLAQPQVAARLKGHRTRLLKVGFAEDAKNRKSSGKALLNFRDYNSGVVQQVVVDLESGSVEFGEVARLVQPSPEEIAEGTAVVLRDPGLSALSADPSLTLMGGYHVKSPYSDDPCSREVCLEFAFVKPGPAPVGQTENDKRPPRRVIVNLSRGAVVNRDYKASADPRAPSPRMTTIGEER